MANKFVRLADNYDFPTVTDAYVIRTLDGNPVGLKHNTQYSGSNIKVLTTTDVTFNVNSLAVAQKNSAKIQALIDALPDSGGCIGIPHDIALTNIRLPTRTISGIPGQPINFRLYGTRPGVQIYGMSTDPLFTLVDGVSGSLYTPSREVTCELRDLSITCRGTGVSVTGCGLYFTADNVVIRSGDDLTEPRNVGPAWKFKNCYGMRLGKVGAFNGFAATGFLFDSCIHLTFGHLWARGNHVGVEVKNTDHRSGNFFGTWDCEGNFDFQVKLDGLQKSLLGLYMESEKRISLKNCENLDFVGDGFRVDEIDASSKLLNPRLFEVELVRQDIGQAFSADTSNPLTFTGPNSWHHDSSKNAQPAWYVQLAPNFGTVTTKGKVFDIRWRAKGTGTGYVTWHTDAPPGGEPGVPQDPAWHIIPCVLTADWQEFSIERSVCPGNGSFINWTWNQVIGNFPSVEFELLHVAEVVPKSEWCVTTKS